MHGNQKGVSRWGRGKTKDKIPSVTLKISLLGSEMTRLHVHHIQYSSVTDRPKFVTEREVRPGSKLQGYL